MKLKEKNKIILIFGGPGGEHAVSIKSAKAIFENLDRKRFSVLPLYFSKKNLVYRGRVAEKILRGGKISSQDRPINFFNFLDKKNFSLIFPIIHGDFGEDGKLQAILDFYQTPYLFSNFSTMVLTIDKFKTKIFLQKLGIKSPQGVLFEAGDDLKIIKKMNFPLIAKPVDGGSSVGIFILKNKKEAREAKFKRGEKYLIEEFIKGRELTVSIMGNQKPQILAITEIIPKLGEFYDYNSKYKKGGSEHICPALLNKKIENKIKKTALKIYQATACRDLARVDFILDKKNELYFIEVNTVPGMTATSLVPEAAKVFGLDFREFLNKLILRKIGK